MQQQDARSGMLITDATLVMIATNVMLASRRLPMTNDKWEDLRKYLQIWVIWKGIYKKLDKQAMAKRQAAGGRDQFGVAVLGADAGGDAAPGGGGNPVTIDEIEGCFDSLDADATTGKAT